MAGIGGFEPAPLLVVGVSGGADSMALVALADEWARSRGGRAVAITVDHGLRPESAAEAAGVASRMAALGIAHHVAIWDGPKPETGVEEAARTARYDALIDHCRSLGAPHLLVAHHADDQAETTLLRLCRGSGPDGLAGMAPIRDLGAARLIRPLLTVPRHRLLATCRARGLEWFDDPGNATERFARGRLRRLGPVLGREGLDTATLGATATRCATTRRFMDKELAGLAAAAASVSPYGFITLDRAPMLDADGELSTRLLARALAAVGGGDRAPRHLSVARLWTEVAGDAWNGAIADPRARRTLGGCLVAPMAGNRVLICREHAAALAAPPPSGAGRWDGRFTITYECTPPRHAADAEPSGAGRRIAALGPGGWRRVGVFRPPEWAVPSAVRPTLPALWRGNEVVAVADFGLDGKGADGGEGVMARFEPRNPLVGPPFPVVSRPDDII